MTTEEEYHRIVSNVYDVTDNFSVDLSAIASIDYRLADSEYRKHNEICITYKNSENSDFVEVDNKIQFNSLRKAWKDFWRFI